MNAEEAYVRYRAELLRYLARRLRSVQDAEDALQEAFARFVRYGDGAHHPQAYLWSVVRAVVHDRQRRPEIIVFNSDLAAEAADREMPRRDLATEYVELEQRLQAVLTALPDLQASILLLRFLQGMSHAEVAQSLAISPHTVKKYLFRSMTQLRSV
jgi:RNA polymerase sigma-70 factor (ECF subfamily)